MVAGMALAVLMPRLMGPRDYGLWILFRSLILVLTTGTMLGTQQVMSRFYGSWGEERPPLADHLLKSVAFFRFVVVLLAAVAAFALTPRVGGGAFGGAVGGWAALAVWMRGTAITGLVLLYGARAMVSIAVLQVLMGTLGPLGALLGRQASGFGGVPPACAAAETVTLLAAAWLARRWLAWPHGWLPRERLRRLIRFGGVIAIASLGANLFVDAAICLAPALGATPAQVAYLGLSTRLDAVLLTGLLSINRAMLPALSRVADRGQMERSVHWLGLLARAGATLLMPALGLLPLLGRPVIRLVWGADFEAALPVMVLSMAGALPVWLGASHVTLAMLTGRAGLQLTGVVAMYAGFAVGLLVAAPLDPARRLAVAMGLGAAANMTALAIGLRRAGCICPRLDRLWIPLLVTAVPVILLPRGIALAPGVALALCWLIVYMLTVGTSRFVTREEAARLFTHAHTALRARRSR